MFKGILCAWGAQLWPWSCDWAMPGSSWVFSGQLSPQELQEALPVEPWKMGSKRWLLRAGPGPLSGYPQKAHQVPPVKLESPLRAVQVWARSLRSPAHSSGCLWLPGTGGLCWAFPGVLWGTQRLVRTEQLLQAAPAPLSWPVRGLLRPITAGLLPGLWLPPVARGATQVPPALLRLPERAAPCSLWGSGSPPAGLPKSLPAPQAWALLLAAPASLQVSVRAPGSWQLLLTLPPAQRLSWACPASLQRFLCSPLPLRGPG